jgi:WD40 repeat protein
VNSTMVPILVFVAFSCPTSADDTPDASLTDLHGDPLPKHATGRLGTVRFLPTAATVSNLAWSPDGRHLASLATVFIGEVDPGLQIWDVKTGREVGPPSLAHCKIHAMAWSPDSRLLAISPLSGDVEIWDVVRHERVREISGDGASFEGLCWSPDGKRIGVADKDEAVTIFDASSGAKERSFKFAASCLDFSRDSKRVVAGSGRRFRIWDVQTGKQFQKFKVKHKTTFSVRFAPDDQSLVVTGEATSLVNLSEDKPRVVELSDEGIDRVSSFSASFSPNGDRLLTGGGTHSRLWDTRTRKVLREFPNQRNFASSFSLDGERLVFGNRRLTFVDAGTGVEQDRFSAHSRVGLGLALTSDGKTAYSINAGPIIRKWDVGSTKQTGELTLPTGSARSVAVSRDGRTVAVAQKNDVHLFDTRTGRAAGEPYRHEQLVSSVAFSPTRDLLVSRSSDGTAQFRNFQSGALEATMDLGMSPIHLGYSVFSRDGRMLALVSPDKSTVDLVNAVTRKRVRKIQIHEALVSLFLPTCFLPDKEELALLTVSPDPEDETRVLYHFDLQDLASGVFRRRLQGAFEYPSAIACSPQGDVIAVADGTVSPRKHFVRVYSTATGKLVAQFNGHVDRIRELTFSPDGSRLFSTSQDTTTLIWSLKEVRAGLADKPGS